MSQIYQIITLIWRINIITCASFQGKLNPETKPPAVSAEFLTSYNELLKYVADNDELPKSTDGKIGSWCVSIRTAYKQKKDLNNFISQNNTSFRLIPLFFTVYYG